MAFIRRGTTPTKKFEVDIDLRQAKLFLTFKQKGQVIIEKTNDDLLIEEFAITAYLTQKETLLLDAGHSVEIQLRYVFENGTADASEVLRLSVKDILKDGEIEYV